MSALVLTKVVREHVELIDDREGISIGEQINHQIAGALAAGIELQTIVVEFAEGDWDKMARHYHGVKPTDGSVAIDHNMVNQPRKKFTRS